MVHRCNIEDLIGYLDGKMSPDAENAMKEHIKRCENCKKAYYLFSFSEGFIKSPCFAGNSVDKNIMASIDKSRYKNKKTSLSIALQYHRLKPVLKLTAAVFVLYLLLFSVIVYKSTLKPPYNDKIAVSSSSPEEPINTNTPNATENNIESISIDDLRKNPHFPADEYEFKELTVPVNTDKLTALSSAKTMVGDKSYKDAKKITAILVSLTNKKHPYIAGSSIVLKDYPVWIVTFYNLHLTTQGGPKNAYGVQEAKVVIADTNVFIDANTGEELQSISYSVFSQSDAIKKVLELHSHSGFPDSPGKVSGILHAGGKAPGLSIPAEFETKVEKESDWAYTVTLTQYWNAKDLRGPNSKGPVLFYYWKYRATVDNVVEIDSGGDNTPLIMK